MAKVKHSQLVDYVKGRVDNSVLYGSSSKTFSVMRRYVYPVLTVNNHTRGSIMKNLSVFWRNASTPWKQDLAAYTTAYFNIHVSDPGFVGPPKSAFAHLVRMLQNAAESDPQHIDLPTITVADMVALDNDVKTVRRAIVAGFLPDIGSESAAWTAGIG